MKYYELMYSTSNMEYEVVCAIDDLYGFDPYRLNEGVRIDNWNDKITFKYSKNEKEEFTDYLSNDLGWQLFSRRFVELTRDLIEKDVQYLNVLLENKDTGEIMKDEYYVLNPLSILPAVDMEKSVVIESEWEGEKTVSITMPAIKECVVREHNIYRIDDDLLKFGTYLSENIVRLVKKYKLTGMAFCELTVVGEE